MISMRQLYSQKGNLDVAIHLTKNKSYGSRAIHVQFYLEANLTSREKRQKIVIKSHL